MVTENNKEKQVDLEENLDQLNDAEEVEQELVDDLPEEENSDQKYQLLETEKNELYDKHLRLQAEYDNFRKRTQREKATDFTYKSQQLAMELLPVIDNFERALQAPTENESAKNFIEGMEMIYRNLLSVLESEGIEVIPTVGQEFDPTIHQAVVQVEDEQYESNVVVEELQKGYRLKDRVLRPAMVKVNQ